VGRPAGQIPARVGVGVPLVRAAHLAAELDLAGRGGGGRACHVPPDIAPE
jgi:hypothetical protein